MQDRYPEVAYHNAKNHLFLVSNFKGGGIRSLRKSFVVRAERLSDYQDTLDVKVLKPVNIHFFE